MQQMDDNEIIHVLAIPMAGFSTKPIYDEWIQAEYANCLMAHWDFWKPAYNHISRPPDQVMTTLFDEAGNPKFYNDVHQ